MTVWTIYCHTHRDSGRRYIGVTKLTVEKRWKLHVESALRSSKPACRHFAFSIRAYGPDAFDHEGLAQAVTFDDANAIERAVVAQYDATDPARGFNLSPGGALVGPFSFWGSVEARRRASERAKAYWNDPEFRAKCTASATITLNRPEVRAKRDASLRAGEGRKRIAQAMAARMADPKFKERMREVARRNGLANVAFAEAAAARRTRFTEATHCSRGHEFTPENTRYGKGRIRNCRACINARARARHVRKPKPTHCKRGGHEFTPENTVKTKAGRGCRTCLLERRKANYRAARAAGLSVTEAANARGTTRAA